MATAVPDTATPSWPKNANYPSLSIPENDPFAAAPAFLPPTHGIHIASGFYVDATLSDDQDHWAKRAETLCLGSLGYQHYTLRLVDSCSFYHHYSKVLTCRCSCQYSFSSRICLLVPFCDLPKLRLAWYWRTYGFFLPNNFISLKARAELFAASMLLPLENHPNLLIQCRITRWTPNRQGIIDCWDQERNANFPQLTQHSLQLDAEWKEWVAGTRLEFLEDANDEDNDGNKDNE